MTISRTRFTLLFGLLAVFFALPAHAQGTADLPPPEGREASFLPLSDTAPPATININKDSPVDAAPANPLAVPPENTSPLPPVLITPPVMAQPSSPHASKPSDAPLPSPVIVPAPPAATPVMAVPSKAPSLSASLPPVALPSPASVPASPTPAAEPIDLGEPVESSVLSDINAESVGLFSPNEGGLGASMWKGTLRDLAERLLPSLNLPSFSPVLNSLAQRFLLTTADVPSGKSSGQSLTSMRVEELIALGDVKDAWKLVVLAKPDQIDETTLRLMVEVALVSGDSANICPRLPDIIKTHTSLEWQKSLLICQLTAKDNKAAQLTLELMRTQGIKDDAFFFIAERNVIAGAKQLPRQLTPLKPLIVALLRLAGLPLPGEVYAHPDAAVIPALLLLKAKDDKPRLALAERAAERGIITAIELEDVYTGIVFMPDVLTNALNSTETGPRLHALLYQAAMQEKTPQEHIDLAVKFLQGVTVAGLNGVQAQVLADMVGKIRAAEEYNASSASIARIYIAARKPEGALEWFKLSRHASVGMPGVAADLHDLWPLAVFAGLETDSDYAQNLGKWLESTLKTESRSDADSYKQHTQGASILLLLDAAGFAVPEEDWAKVMNSPVFERRPVPPAVLLERLRTASTSGRRGETALFSLLLSGGNTDEPSFLATLAVIRALRLIGLTADAATLARETAALVLAPPAIKP